MTAHKRYAGWNYMLQNTEILSFLSVNITNITCDLKKTKNKKQKEPQKNPKKLPSIQKEENQKLQNRDIKPEQNKKDLLLFGCSYSFRTAYSKCKITLHYLQLLHKMKPFCGISCSTRVDNTEKY